MKREPTHRQPAQAAVRGLAGMSVIWLATAGNAGWNPFTEGAPIPVGHQSGDLAIADVNGDGFMDILVSFPLKSRASILLGDGHGEFSVADQRSVTFGYDPAATAMGDVNGDNRPDLAVVSRDGSTPRIHVWINENGSFRENNKLGFSPGQIGPNSWKPALMFAHVNGDSYPDLIYADGRQNAINVFHGTESGQFVPGQTIALDERFDNYSCVAGDINGDKLLDLAVVASYAEGQKPGRLIVLLGNGKGELETAPQLAAEVPSNAKIKSLGDVDGDQRTDVVLTHGESGTVLVQSKDGQLTRSAGSPFDVGREAFGVAAVHAGFANNDVLVLATADSLDILFADKGEFHHACNTPIPAGPGVYKIATGDLNSDGKADIVANSFEGDDLSILLSN